MVHLAYGKLDNQDIGVHLLLGNAIRAEDGTTFESDLMTLATRAGDLRVRDLRDDPLPDKMVKLQGVVEAYTQAIILKRLWLQRK